MKLIASLFVTLILAACATTGGTPQSPAQAVYAVQGNYAAALTVAVAYKNLPRCTQPVTVVLCSKASVVEELQRADNVAYPALQAAQNTVRTPGSGANTQTAIVAAQQAVAALASITATLTVK